MNLLAIRCMSFWTDCPVWIPLFYLNIGVDLPAWLLTPARSRLLQSAVLSAAGQSWSRPRSSHANPSSYISRWGKRWQKMEEKNNGLLTVVDIPPPSVHHDDQEIYGKTQYRPVSVETILFTTQRVCHIYTQLFFFLSMTKHIDVSFYGGVRGRVRILMYNILPGY